RARVDARRPYRRCDQGGNVSPPVAARGEGPPILLLHDASTTPADWEQLVELMEPWMRVLTLQVGPASREEAGSLAAAAGELGLLGDARFGVVGHGAGGAVAQLLAVDERTREALKTLVLMDSLAFTPELEGVAEQLALLDELPVFMMWGEDDEVVPVATAERLAEAIPYSTLAVIPEAGHRLPAEDGFNAFPLVYQFLRLRFLEKGHGHDDEPGGPVMIEILTEPPAPGGRG
ncbi:MAG: alpha/beta hydrolase, partial [Actinomycetota bacterium]